MRHAVFFTKTHSHRPPVTAPLLVGLVLALMTWTLSPSKGMAADPQTRGPITVEDVWVRASAGMARAGGGFMLIHNAGSTPDRLITATADVSDIVELHTHRSVNGMMQMRKVADIPLPAGETVHLRPGGLHVMFIDLNAPLKEGETFPLTLTFDKAGDLTVTARVLAPGAMGPGHMQGMGRLGGAQ